MDPETHHDGLRPGGPSPTRRFRLRPEERRLFRELLIICAVVWFVHMFIESPAHEYGHYWVAGWLGFPVQIDGDRTLWITGQSVPALTRALVSVSGGLFAGVIVLVLWLLVRKPYGMGLLALVAADFAYAPLDGTPAGYAIGLVAFSVVWALVFARYFARFADWNPPQSLAWLSRLGIAASPAHR